MMRIQNAVARVVAKAVGLPKWLGSAAYFGFMGMPVVVLLAIIAVFG